MSFSAALRGWFRITVNAVKDQHRVMRLLQASQRLQGEVAIDRVGTSELPVQYGEIQGHQGKKGTAMVFVLIGLCNGDVHRRSLLASGNVLLPRGLCTIRASSTHGCWHHSCIVIT